MCKKRLRVIKLKRGDSIFERNVTADGVRSVWNRLQIFRICRETGLTFEFDPGVGSVVSLSRGHGTIYGSFFGYGKEIFMTTEFSVKRISTRIIIKFKYFNIGRHKIRNPKKLHAFLDKVVGCLNEPNCDRYVDHKTKLHFGEFMRDFPADANSY